MKISFKNIIPCLVILPFILGMLCCSLCGIAQAKDCDASYVLRLDSNQHHPPCCPVNNKYCHLGGTINVLKPEKAENLTLKTVSQFSKIAFLSLAHANYAYLTSFPDIAYQSPPRSLQKSVQIYLFDRVLRL